MGGHLQDYAKAGRKRTDQGEYWWELRSCDYYDDFDKPKIVWPDIAKLPRFAWDSCRMYGNDTTFFLPVDDWSLLGLLQSRALWYAISQMCQPLRLRAGLWQYRLKTVFISRLPIPILSCADREAIGALAASVTDYAQARYELHCQARHRIHTDLGSPGKSLNNRLTSWWDLDLTSTRSELRKCFKQDIPVQDRDSWEAWLIQRRGDHQRLTTGISCIEEELNDRVYSLFGLTAEERRVIEEETKYPFGAV